MDDKTWKGECLLLLASAIWGFAFVAQRVGMAHIGPFLFNGIRFALGALVLLPFLSVAKRKDGGAPPAGSGLARGIASGVVLFLGASCQQVGIVSTTAGKAGFITGLYVILVPILGLFRGRLPGAATWAGALLASIGLYLLSATGRLAIGRGDSLVLASAFFFALHVIVIGCFTRSASRPVALAAIQFATCSLLSLAAALLLEEWRLGRILDAAVPLLYGGLLSTGVAYTLQVVAQRHVAAPRAAILLSLEAVFAGIGGWILLGEILSPRGIAGAALMLGGIIVSRARSAGGAKERSRPGGN